MSTKTGKDLNLVKPALTDDHKVTIGTDLPANFQKIDDEFTAHLADTVQDSGGVHGLEIESGTWVPVLKGTTTAGTHTYAVQEGSFVRNGDWITATGYISLTKDTSIAGNIIIDGLPYNISGNKGFAVISLISGINVETEGYRFVTLTAFGGVSYVGLQKSILNASSATTALTAANLLNTIVIRFGVVYKKA